MKLDYSLSDSFDSHIVLVLLVIAFPGINIDSHDPPEVFYFVLGKVFIQSTCANF